MSVISGTSLAGSDTNVSQSSYTTGSVTPTAGALAIVCIASRTGSATPNVPTLSGCSITWNQYLTTLSADNHTRVTVFIGTSNSPTAGALTASFGGQNQDGFNYVIDQLTGINTVGGVTNAIVQKGTATNAGSQTGISVTLSSFAHPANATYGFVFINGVVVITEAANFTRLQQTGGLLGESDSEFAGNNQTSVGWTWPSFSSTGNIGIALEIRAKSGFFGGMI